MHALCRTEVRGHLLQLSATAAMVGSDEDEPPGRCRGSGRDETVQPLVAHVQPADEQGEPGVSRDSDACAERHSTAAQGRGATPLGTTAVTTSPAYARTCSASTSVRVTAIGGSANHVLLVQRRIDLLTEKTALQRDGVVSAVRRDDDRS